MTLSIFSNPDGNDPKMFFDLNGQEYEFYTDYETHTEFDIVVLGGPTNPIPMPKTKLKLELAIWHNHENQSRFGTYSNASATRSSSDTVILTNASDPIINDAQWVIYNDFLFNRTKAYYLGYSFRPDTTRWYYNEGAYVLPNITTSEHKTKLFVSPNNTYSTSNFRIIKYRPSLVQLLLPYKHIGYLGNHDVDSSLVLYAENEFTKGENIQQIENSRHFAKFGPWGYNPPHSEYYKNTFISIYGETIEYGTSIAPTEKTYDPLIKGHFILPFSTNGFIEFLKTKGFKFPKFINYGYDAISDDDARFQAYSEEVIRLLAISLVDWQQLWDENLDIIQHNRQIFIDTPYDRVDLYNYL